jgi:uncharacterized protein
MMRYALPFAAVLLLAAPAAAQMHPHHDVDASQTRLRLIESAQRTVKQDRLRAILRAEVSGPDARRVQAEINRRMTAAVEKAKTVSSVRVETGSYGLYEDRPNNASPVWRGQQTLSLIGTEFGDVLQLAGELQQSGLVFSGMNFELRPETARTYEDELTAEAIARLKERADRVAQTMGLKVEHFREINVGNVLGDPPPRPMMRMREMSAAQAAPPVAEAGEQVVQISVQADIVLAPR